MSIRIQFTLAFLIVLLLPMAGLSFFNYQKNVDDLLQRENDVLLAMLDSIVNDLDAYVHATTESIRADAHIPGFAQYLEASPSERKEQEKNLTATLRSVVLKDAVFAHSAALVDLSGQNLLDTDARSKGGSEADWTYYKELTLSQRQSAMLNLNESNSPVDLYIAAPVIGRNGLPVGYIRLLVDVSILQSIVILALRNISDSFQVVLVDLNGIILADSADRSAFSSKYQYPELLKQFNPVKWSEDLQSMRAISQMDTLDVRVMLIEKGEAYWAPATKLYEQWLLQIAFITLFGVVASIMASELLTRPIRKIRQAASKIERGSMDYRVPDFSSSELRELAVSINSMTDKLVQSYRKLENEHENLQKAELELKHLNEELEMRVDRRTNELSSKKQELSQAMEQVMQTEKLASLGSMVAGVSHELNTPIGIALTGATALRDQVGTVSEKMEQKTLTASDFTKFTETAKESTELIEDNCKKASEMIASFKQVAVDQASDRKRLFGVLKTLQAIKRTLRPLLKRTKHTLEFDVDPSIEMDSYPGPFDQIITNLVNNSVLHGFDHIEEGHMNISARELEDNQIQIDYEDDGKGISNEIKEKIFAPFFTTKSDEGGSGLGMHIVNSLATGILQGQIELLEKKGPGVHFRITLPKDID